jgi:hypothetical protein
MAEEFQGSPPGNRRIEVDEPAALRYWCEELGVSPEDLKEIVTEVGDRLADVERRLGEMAGGRSGN